MSTFIFMLTKNDQTVASALEVYEEVRSSALGWVGFKDVGASIATLRELARRIHDDGRSVALEVVSTDLAAEVASVRTGVEIGVDILMGGTNVVAATRILDGSGIKYFPFPGRIVGHPSVLEGTIEEIAESARGLSATPGVTGLDLLAYRNKSVDVPSLIDAVIKASAGPIVVAGSIDSAEQVELVTSLGAWAFTIGGAVFDRALVPGGSIREQIDVALAWSRKEMRLSGRRTSPGCVS